MEHIFVKSGEVHCSDSQAIFKTVLGSCVSVCLWDEQLRIGGLNHFILPAGRHDEVDARFGNIAIPQLIRRLEALGCSRLVAKVFGGAAVMPSGSVACVGDANTELALALLRERRIPVIAQRTGGAQGIVIQYWSGNGDVLVREICPSFPTVREKGTARSVVEGALSLPQRRGVGAREAWWGGLPHNVVDGVVPV